MSGKTAEGWARAFLEHLPAGETSHTPCGDCIALVTAIRKEERERFADIVRGELTASTNWVELKAGGGPCLHEHDIEATLIRALEEEKHMHVNNQDGTDTCARCGKDLRNEIHVRALEVRDA